MTRIPSFTNGTILSHSCSVVGNMELLQILNFTPLAEGRGWCDCQVVPMLAIGVRGLGGVRNVGSEKVWVLFKYVKLSIRATLKRFKYPAWHDRLEWAVR